MLRMGAATMTYHGLPIDPPDEPDARCSHCGCSDVYWPTANQIECRVCGTFGPPRDEYEASEQAREDAGEAKHDLWNDEQA